MLTRYLQHTYNYYRQQTPGGQLYEIAYVTCGTPHTTNKDSPSQAVFGRGILFNIPHTADWKNITAKKHPLSNKTPLE